MFENKVIKALLDTSYGRWKVQQDMLDNRFFTGSLNKREYILASLELMVEYMPKGEKVRSLQYN